MKKYFLAAFAFITVQSFAQNPIMYMLVGSYTGSGKGQGISVYKFNPNKGEADLLSNFAMDNPSYLCISKDRQYVYAVNENPGDQEGAVSALAFDRKNGSLTLINKQPTDGFAPCYISIDTSGKIVVTANYSGGNLTVFPIGENGALQPNSQIVSHEGYGVNVQRQEMPHPHGAVFSPDGKYVFVPDLGNDRLYQYAVNSSQPLAALTAADPQYYTIPDGNGPRSLTFAPDGQTAYLLNELSGDIIVYAYDGKTLTEKQTIKSDISPAKGDKASAHIALSPNGKFLYTSNRGVNEIVIYKVQTDGILLEAGRQPVAAKPRFFTVDPTGRFLLAAAQDGNTIQIFVINKNYGLLQDTNVKIDVPTPVCIVMTPVN